MALERGGGIPAISNCFILRLPGDADRLAQHPRDASSAAHRWRRIYGLTGRPLPPDLLAQLPAFLLVVIGGSLFKSIRTQIDAEKSRLAAALAGSIAHEMRNPLGAAQAQPGEDARRAARPKAKGARQTLETEQVEALYRTWPTARWRCGAGCR